MSFPNTKFGICSRCGRRGNFVTDEGVSTSQSGYKLKEYEGKWLCQLCINELEDARHDGIARDRMAEEERSREAAGFEKA